MVSERRLQVLQTLGLLQLLKKKPAPGGVDVSPGDALVAFARLGVAFVLGADFARAVAAMDIVDERSTVSTSQQQEEEAVRPLVTPVSVAVGPN